MSKTSQRKRSAYDEGRTHAKKGWPFMFTRHPHMAEYQRGYHSVARDHGYPNSEPSRWTKFITWIRRMFI